MCINFCYALIMMNFAQISPSELNSPSCPLYADQSAVLGSMYVVLLVFSLLFAIIFLLLKNKRFGLLFTIYVASLVVIRILYSTDQCGHGGLFASRDSTLIILFIYTSLIIGSFVFGVISQLKHRGSKSTIK